jgi:hypothetical protein
MTEKRRSGQRTVRPPRAVAGTRRSRLARSDKLAGFTRPQSTVRLIAAGAVVALVALGLSACGGGSPPSSVANLGSTTTSTPGAGSTAKTQPNRTSAATPGRDALEFSKCMRSHGVTNFPDPKGNAFVFNAATGPNPDSPQFQAAQRACKKYMPNRGVVTPAQSTQSRTQLLRLAKCMRSHGVANFPEPSSHPTGGWGFDITQASLHVTSPAYQAAAQTCEKSVPGVGIPCTKRRGAFSGVSGAKVRRC